MFIVQKCSPESKHPLAAQDDEVWLNILIFDDHNLYFLLSSLYVCSILLANHRIMAEMEGSEAPMEKALASRYTPSIITTLLTFRGSG